MFRVTSCLAVFVVWVGVGQVSAGPTGSFYMDTVLADNPIGYWRLGETSGPAALDAVSPGQDGTYVGGVSLGQPGALLTDSDTAVEVAGRTSYVDIGVHEAINQLANDFTVEAWVRPNGTGGGQSFLSNRTYWEGAGGIRLGMDGSRLLFTAFGPKDYLSDPSVISAGQWYHVAAVFDADNDVSFFLDGSFVQTVTGSSPANPSVKPLTFGRNPISYGSQAFYSGGLDEVAIYDRSLSAAEIHEHYLAATVPEPSTLALLGMGAIGLMAWVWRKRKRA